MQMEKTPQNIPANHDYKGSVETYLPYPRTKNIKQLY